MLITAAMLAEWCGVSRQAMSKHDQNGRLVHRKDAAGADKVDAELSLQALAGYLSEEKRQRGLARLGDLQGEPDAPGQTSAREPEAAGVLNAKQVEQEYKARMARLDYEERVGTLVPRARIADVVQSAVASFISEMELHRKADADEIAADMGLGIEDSRKLRVLLGRNFRKVRARFSGKMSAAAMDAAIRAESGRLPEDSGAAATH